MIISRYTKRSKNVEKVAKGIIWTFVVFTIAILSWIILYVMVRGFYTRKEVYSQSPDLAERVMQQSRYPEEKFIFIINRKVRAKTIDLEELRLLYTKRRNYWGPVTGQNLRARPFTYATKNPLSEAVKYFLLQEDETFNKYTHTVDSTEAMLEIVEDTPGAIGMIPAHEQVLLAGRRVKVLTVKRICFPINPGVKKIVANIQLGNLSLEDLREVFTGKVKNWQEVGGIDLPVHPVYIEPGNDVYKNLGDLFLAEDSAFSSSAGAVKDNAELLKKIAETEGAIGICYIHDLDPAENLLLTTSYIKSGPNLDIHYILESPAESGAWGGISTIILNTFFLILFTLLFSTPIGIFAAIYLVEYAKQNRLIRLLRLGTETLAGIPSIVFGLFGFIFFVDILHLGIGFISAVLTVTMMVLPTIIRTSEEALKAVPRSFREGSLALGATKLQTIFKVVLPAATPGILSGIILALGRTVGETAVLIYTLGSNYELVRGPSSSARVLSLHLYNMFAEAISFERCFATGTILIFIILGVNLTTTRLIGRLNKMTGRKK